jgi:hypothetical protein
MTRMSVQVPARRLGVAEASIAMPEAEPQSQTGTIHIS